MAPAAAAEDDPEDNWVTDDDHDEEEEEELSYSTGFVHHHWDSCVDYLILSQEEAE